MVVLLSVMMNHLQIIFENSIVKVSEMPQLLAVRSRASKDVFQNPSFKRHDRFGFMYRLPEFALRWDWGNSKNLIGL